MAGYLATLPNPKQAEKRFYETYSVGSTPETADAGSELILSGVKTATSSLLWQYQVTGKPMLEAGSLSKHLPQRQGGHPICIVETSAVEVRPFNEINEAFAFAYGEWGRTLEGWREGAWSFYARECRELGKEPSVDMPLLCEWFQVVYPPRTG